MRRRHFLLAIGGCVWGGVGARSSRAIEVANLKSQLESELKARRPVEFAFIARVVELVEKGRLPYGLVYGTFLYARQKQPRPFVYFERAMRTRAAEIGVAID